MEGLTRQEVEYRKNNGLSNDEKVKYTRTTKERIAVMDISIEIENLEELNKVQKVIRKVDSVYEVRRKR